MAKRKFKPNVVTWNDIDDQSSLANTDPSLNDYLVLAEGDSWFTLGGIPTSNLLFSLRFKKMTMILNCGSPGDTIKHVSDIENNHLLLKALSPDGYKWNLILLSGGGNDLIDEVDKILITKEERSLKPVKHTADYFDKKKLRRLIKDIQDGYRRIVALRDTDGSLAKHKPVLVHTYDYATPRNSPTRFFTIPTLGPWLYKAVTKAEIPKDDWIAVSMFLTDQLAEGLLALQKGKNKIKKFYVVDTRGTLKMAALNTTGDNGDWLNEIHPNSDGYKKIAKVMEKSIRSLLKKR
ncbi:MAG: SGNH/GDSL hydrolase family protein [Candidatus Thiodiazotropha sp. (ex Codakia rugifera)]|nr:SGNH/GDSL hydrolase family protein [Candidatus Thiodiazotropha sp. (ex Codakia rugifera)]